MNADKKKNSKQRGPLRGSVKECLELYFKDLDGHDPSDVYQMVINEVEPVMLETVMQYAGGNQTHAAEILGINRSTLRKKLRQYEIEI
ncbi:hypothetical protein TspCOW1_18670 [Thiohalobacter sp. COW1]|uniref:Putative Fis-like DNA-binding protein n=1 Tax=Thiohalobacter thiocyanaticus TaxID=585455 RepID=A0A1Z4VNM3_9GAMM|nr:MULTISPECIES: DNA-binding transcriptional regulator Fis [Thiohalobacter]BAZ93207.1 transcriptional regulator [Thiohalobacter thiocyanaticus]BCO31764.1 hypothetical protein TspCOW1_18670 [Thiohalobacter sp. COW1]